MRLWEGHGHSHAAAAEASPATRSSVPVRVVTLILLAVIALGTGIGLVMLWPDYDRAGAVAERVDFVAPGVTLERGEVIHIEEGCETISGPQARLPDDAPAAGDGGGTPQCLTVSVGVLTGDDAGRLVEVAVRGAHASAGLRTGDHVELMAVPQVASVDAVGEPEPATATYEVSRLYDISGVFRELPLALLALAFAAVVIAVGRFRGALALLALGISAGVIFFFMLPALVSGGPGIPIAIVGSSAIMLVTLYLVHGPNLRTTAALFGTLFGIGIMALVSAVSVHATRLSGVGDEASGLLSGVAGEIDFRGLLSCAIIIAGLGILNDVTITQASSVWELRAAAPEMSRTEIYARAMRIGRDHIASTVYTVFFAYVGAALSVLIVLYLYDRPTLSLLTQEDIVVEIVRTLCGSIGLVLAVPITTGIAALFASPAAAPAFPAAAPASPAAAPAAPAASPATAPTAEISRRGPLAAD
ncbi:MAG: YibE/F family protein [Leucobacter sp.]